MWNIPHCGREGLGVRINKMKSEKIKITGMSCGHCVKFVEKEISKLHVKKFKVALNSLDVKYDESKVTHEEIVSAIEEAGYEVVENQSELKTK
jgi:copper chaperone CopZ